jgi:hypothetical protein
VPDQNPQVQVVRWAAPTQPRDDDEEFGPAARHATQPAGPWQRILQSGNEALKSSSEAIAVEVDEVAERMMAALEQRQSDRQTARTAASLPQPAWQLNEVEVSFSVQLLGEATVAVFTATAEASAQVTLKFSRSSNLP